MQALQEFHRPSCIADTTRSHSCSSWAFVIMTAVAPFLPQDRSPFCQVCWLRRRINRCRGFVRVVVAVVGIRNWVEMKVMVIMVVARPLLLAWSVLILNIEDIEPSGRIGLYASENRCSNKIYRTPISSYFKR